MRMAPRSVHSPRNRSQGVRGQSLVELALILPVILLMLLGGIEMAGAYGAKMALQGVVAQGTRVGAIEGGGTNCGPLRDNSAIDADILGAVLSGRNIDPGGIQQIQIYRVKLDGSMDPAAVNTYRAPFTTTVAGTTLPVTTTGNYNWPPCQRKANEPSDSLGIHVTYAYKPIVAIPGVKAIMINDRGDQHLNPTRGSVPCPIPDPPHNVAASWVAPEPSASDLISWDPSPGAESYDIYATVNGVLSSSPVITGVLSTSTGRLSYNYTGNTTDAPAQYAVAARNYCGAGNPSLPASNGQCTLPLTTTIITTTQAITPSTDVITWTTPGITATAPTSASYLITETTSLVTETVPITSAPLWNTWAVTATAPFSPAPRGAATYKMSMVNPCGLVGPASNAATRLAPPPPTPTNTATAVPTSTSTNTTTAVPTNTSTSTPVPANTATATPVPTSTSTNTPVPANTATATATATATPTPVSIDDANSRMTYAGSGWTHCSAGACGGNNFSGLYNGTFSYDGANGDSVTLSFTGTGIDLYSVTSNLGGTGTVSIDGVVQATTVNYYSSAQQPSSQVWSISSLSNTTHVFVLKNTNSNNAFIGIDKVVVH